MLTVGISTAKIAPDVLELYTKIEDYFTSL